MDRTADALADALNAAIAAPSARAAAPRAEAALRHGLARQEELGLRLQWTLPQALRYYFEVSQPTPSVNVLREMHFHEYRRARRMWSLQVAAQLRANGFAPRPPVALAQSALVVVRHCAGQLDWDNALGGLKLLQDCLVQPSKRNPDGLGLVCDDSPRHMPYPPFMKQMKAPRARGRTEVWIFEVPG